MLVKKTTKNEGGTYTLICELSEEELNDVVIVGMNGLMAEGAMALLDGVPGRDQEEEIMFVHPEAETKQ